MASALASLTLLLCGWPAAGDELVSSREACTTLDCLVESSMDQNMDDGLDGGLMLLQTNARTALQRLNSSSGDSDGRTAKAATHRLNRSMANDGGEEVGYLHGNRTSKTPCEKEPLTQAAIKVQASVAKRSNSTRTLPIYRSNPEGLFESMHKRIEYELKPLPVPMKNKIVLAILEGLTLGCCGIDRCYMGQTCLGIIKGVTLGGIGIWATIDYFVVLINCLSSSPDIDTFGFRANFKPDTIHAAFWIMLILFICKVISCCHKAYLPDPDEKP